MLEMILAEGAIYLSTKALDRVGESTGGSVRRRALERAYRQALRAFFAELPAACVDYTDAFDLFFHDEAVVDELTGLLALGRNTEVNITMLRQRAEQHGYDFSAMPELSFDQAVRSFALALLKAAGDSDVLLAILSHQELQRLHSAVERLETRIAALTAQLEQNIAPLQIVAHHLHISLTSAPSTSRAPQVSSKISDELLFQRLSQRFIRYVTLGVDNNVPPMVHSSLSALAMVQPHWTERWSDTVEVVLSINDLVITEAMLRQVTVRQTSKDNPDPEAVRQAFYDVVIDYLNESLNNLVDGIPRPPSPLSTQAQRDGLPYVILGVPPWLANVYEIARVALHPQGFSTPARSDREIVFESVEDAQQVLSRYSPLVAEAAGDSKRFQSLLIQASTERLREKMRKTSR